MENTQKLFIEEERDELEEDRKRLSELGEAKLDIKHVFYRNLDDMKNWISQDMH